MGILDTAAPPEVHAMSADRPNHANAAEMAQRPARRPGRRRWIMVAAIMAPLVISAVWGAYAGRMAWQRWLETLRLHWLVTGGTAGAMPAGPQADQITIAEDGSVELGEFGVSRFDPLSGTWLTTRFQLKGQVARGEDAFEEYVNGHRLAFREQVTMTVRNCSLNDLADPKALGRKLAVRLNRVLGARCLKSMDVEGLEVYDMAAPAEADAPEEGEASEAPAVAAVR